MADLKGGEEIYAGYIREVTGAALKHFTGPPNELVHRTYRLACEMYQDPTTPEESMELLKLTFKLWTAARLSTLPTFIVGHSALDMGYCTVPQSQVLAKRAAVPPFLGAQLKLTLLHHIQETIAPNLVAKLQSMTSRNSKHTWLALYLTTFMLLHNTTLLMAHALAECRSIGGRGFVPMVREHFHEANILLAHFHYCNRGLSPLSGDAKDCLLRVEMGLDEAKVQFIRYTRQFAKARESRWKKLESEEKYEDDTSSYGSYLRMRGGLGRCGQREHDVRNEPGMLHVARRLPSAMFHKEVKSRHPWRRSR
ncbi:hypothetical protein Purlil1_9284 [Purpureocillium lilacinum]|uniref:Uncharacterized protein n=1 Tax=Purpureocillium lilacinum TaxID=33203 RepID=A0ABR0BRX2_PURLI|nr:hypothetical protein Purlil1_9284 [Purpureocillium lilacinum]